MTRILKVDRWNPAMDRIDLAVSALSRGKLVGFPTETVYGLGANGLDGEAVASIFRAKGRPSDNPLILHVGKIEDVEKVAFVDERAKKTMELFWPGPLTLVLPARKIVPSEVTAGLDTVAVRMPSHPVALALLQRCPFPLAAPSANRSGRPSPTDAETVALDIGEAVEIVIDSGSTDVGVESTVIDITGRQPLLLRPGGFPLEDLLRTFPDISLPSGKSELKRSPGTRYRHYAPNVTVELWKDNDRELWNRLKDARVAYMGIIKPPVSVVSSLIFDSPESYGRGLFAALRELEKKEIDLIVAQWPDAGGIGLALRDRLSRAAGKA